MFVDDGLKPAEALVDHVGQLLLEAADLIEQYGWTQRAYGNRWTGFCVHGALFFNHRQHGGTFDETINASGRFADYVGTIDVIGWNDAPWRTKRQVIDALRAAAHKQEPVAQ